VALVDELAHTNAPGSRFAKRYQDVEELLRAGINVISTLNIQHLESLYDMIEKSTGVKVKERIPDYVLGMANQLVNVDLSAEDLRERLQSGKVYPAERAKLALDHFFTPDNLTRLRELALSEIAHLLDRRRREQAPGAPPDSKDRVLVCISSRSPNPTALLRKAARLADRLDAQWFAVYIQTSGESLERVGAAVERQVSNALALAHQLGATLNPKMESDDVVGAIATFVKEYDITYVLLGRTQRPWYQRWFGRSVLERLLQRVENVDVMVVHGV
jgi:two-component system sensor histidine kinase KdpD